ncbi:transcription elongation regulator 1 isoform X6 [Pararge aegeria]|uniref:transcription elongation regulator 1 isoform X6 n=1 Tax=Pararge aegeria TaxID=116150 RepID=UPI0019D2B568|nr:transcription elongation regulator 1 isoform X6 [Pararge aegeria]
MEDEYMDSQDSGMNDSANRSGDGNDSINDASKDFTDLTGYDDNYDDEDGGNSFRGGRGGRGNFSRGRGRGPPPAWMNGPPPMRFRGRGYGPGGPPMRGRGFFRGRGGPRFGPNNGPNFDSSWGPMGPPPPGMMGGPPPFGPPPGMMPPGGPMGPPPNMMGQPPPFGPNGMPPPTIPAPEVWVETKSDAGQSYYYHSRTRETTWTRPQESPSCKVITQSDMESMAAASQMPPGSMGGQSMGMNGPMGGPPMGGPPMGMMPNGMMGMMPPGVGPQGPAPGSMPPFMNQPPPWVKEQMQQSKALEIEDSPQDDDSPPGVPSPTSQPVSTASIQAAAQSFAQAHGAPAQGQHAMVPPVSMSGSGTGGPGASGAVGSSGTDASMGGPPGLGFGPPGGPPGLGMGPGSASVGGAWGQWGWAPPNLAAALPEGADSQGSTQQQGAPLAASEAPACDQLKKSEIKIPPEISAKAAEWTSHRAPDGRPYYYHSASRHSVWEKPIPIKALEDLQAKIAAEKGESFDKMDLIDPEDVIDVDAHADAVAAAEAAAEERERERLERERQEKEKAEKEKAEKEKAEKEKADKEKAKTDKSRPVSSTPISGTPWCVVWTGDGRVFFYNPTARLSVWERPAQLAGRADVDQAVSQPPHGKDAARKEPATAPSKNANGELKRNAASDTSDSEPEPVKKPKPEETPRKKPAQVIDIGKEAAMEAESRAARERAVVPFEQRVRAFLEMLHESDVSAFSPWEKELHKIVFDSRYLLLDSKERKQVFDKYVRERAEEERKEKKNRLLQKKMQFRALMEEAKLHSKSSFTDFSSKFGRDERFKSIEKMRDRETYFNEYIVEVRKKDKEEKDRKREQAKSDFIALLKDKAIDRHSRWVDTKKKIDSDARYKAVESSTLREDYFREYCKMVKDERKKEKDGKEKERDRGSKKEKKDKDREKEKDKDKDKEKEKERDKDSKKDKKKEKPGDKLPDQPAEVEKKQPTPPPDQWAEILGIPGEDESKDSKSTKSCTKREGSSEEASEAKSPSPEKDMRSPKQLRSSKKEPAAEKKSPIKSPPKKRRNDFKSPEPEPEKKGKKKVEKVEKVEKAEKTEKRKRKKSEKE